MFAVWVLELPEATEVPLPEVVLLLLLALVVFELVAAAALHIAGEVEHVEQLRALREARIEPPG